MTSKHAIIQLGVILLPVLPCVGQNYPDSTCQKLLFNQKHPNPNFRSLNGRYGKDENHAFYNASLYSGVFITWCKIEGSDAKTFELLGEDSPYAKDKNHLYYHDSRDVVLVENIDLSSVQYLGNDYLKDAYSVFFIGKKLPFADVNTFEVSPFKSVFSKDKSNVYYCSFDTVKIIEKADPVTFVFLDFFSAKDAAFVYYNGKVLEQADSKTFEILFWKDGGYSGYAKDKKNVFYHGKIIFKSDRSTFELVGHDYAKDANTVYFGGNSIKGSDPDTFQCYLGRKEWNGGYYDAEDKNNRYLYGVEISKK